EKLVDPETDSAKKIPCFDLLVAACDRFPPAALKDYIDGLWDGIRLEALNPAEKGLRHPESLLNALATIIRTSQQLTSAEGLNSDLVALLEKILSSCEPFVLQAEIGMAPRTLTVLQAVARIDSKICCRIAEKVLPWLMELAQGSTVNSVNRAEIAAESTPTLAEWCHLVVEMDSAASSFTPRLRDALTRLSLDILCRSATISTVAAGFSIGETLAATSDFKTDADDLVQLSKLALKAVVAFSDFEQVREACHLYLRAVAMKNWPIFNREIVPMLKSDVVAERLMVVAYSIHDTTSANVLFPSLIDLFKSAQYEDLAENVLLSLPVVFHLNEGNDQLINTCLSKALPVIIDWAQENHSAVDSVAICLQDISLELGEQ
uniref:MMS19 nucleotide excision repair protein n=1 Tax=Plectus sambesii TaxID=2011161 RepID=A0A914UNX0_9BILA